MISQQLIIRSPAARPSCRTRSPDCQPAPAAQLPGGGGAGFVPRRGGSARLHPVGREPARRVARGGTGRAPVRPGRGRRTVTITEAGTLLLRHVIAISSRLQAARADLLAYAAGEHGTLRVGVYRASASKLLPAIVQRFGSAGRGSRCELSEAPDQGLLDLVELGAWTSPSAACRSQTGRSRPWSWSGDPCVARWPRPARALARIPANAPLGRSRPSGSSASGRAGSTETHRAS